MIKPFKYNYFFNYKENYKKNLQNYDSYFNLFLLKRHSNIFLVLSNKDNKHIKTLTAGYCKMGKKKKEKMAVHNLGIMVKVLLEILKESKITFLHLYIRQRFNSHYFNLCRLLRRNNIRIIKFNFILKIPHGFRKSRKLRRI
jgi:ribosomal protein S11